MTKYQESNKFKIPNSKFKMFGSCELGFGHSLGQLVISN